ncbi:MAG: XdhC family protein [Bacteroidales bacterium]
MKHIHRQVLEHIQSGKKTILATVIRSSGSTPQKPGSSALFDRHGLLAGTVGGGLLEARVQTIAREALDTGFSGQYVFNLDSSQGNEGALCGGETTVLIDARPETFLRVFEDMDRTISRRTGGILLTVLRNGEGIHRTIHRSWIAEGELEKLSGDFAPSVRKALERVYSREAGREFMEVEVRGAGLQEQKEVFLEQIRPLPRLIIAGAGHVGKALAHLGSLLDFEITVVDDRSEFASRENIPEADHFMVSDIGRAMRGIAHGKDTYVVIVTRGHEQDAEALKPWIGSGAAYVGMIGSKHKVAAMRKQFLEQGWATPAQWAAIHTPIGLEIGSKTVQEIAISIAAQLVLERNRKKEPHE